MKAYIAGKIGNLSPDDYKPKFERAAQVLLSTGYVPVIPYQLDHKPDSEWEDYMKTDIAAMLGCDAVYALNNWRSSKGARIEIGLAIKLNIPIIFQ